jgi:DNA-binding transcriptional LysR family regulator
MDTENLRVFLQIVDAGSIQGAARALGLSRSSLRRSLDVLEAEVGAPLVHRDPTGVRLTPAGTVVAEQGRAVVESAKGLVANARAAEREVWGTIRVIEPVGLPLALHVNALLTAHLALPRQRLVVRHVENPLSNLGEPFELMLHEGPAPDRNAWFSCVILRTQLRLMASRDYLARRGTPSSVAELADHDTLGWIRPTQPAGWWPLLAGGAVEVTPWLSSADPHLLATVAARGGGLLLAPRMPFFEGGEEGSFETVLGEEVGAELVFRVTTPFPHRADARTRETLSLIIAQLEGLPMD